MLKNYLKIAIRNLVNRKAHSFINILGLAVGMVCAIFILLWVQDKLSFDKFHENASDLYRVESNLHLPNAVQNWTSTPAQLARALRVDFPEVLNSTRLKGYSRVKITVGNTSSHEKDFYFTDPSLFEMFSFPLKEGDAESALNNPYSIVITENVAARIFPDENPLGKSIKINDRFDFVVTGIIKTIPANSSLHFQFLAPFESLKAFGEHLNDWGRFDFKTYVLLQKNVNYRQFERKITTYLQTKRAETKTTLHLRPLTKIHLYFGGKHARIYNVMIFTSIAIIVLLVACINFLNLMLARANDRTKEIGLRKAIGAHRFHIILQFLGESILSAFLSLLVALVLIEITAPFFTELTGKNLAFSHSANFSFIFLLFGMALLTGIFSGLYPALLLSSFQPGTILKGVMKSGPQKAFVRRTLLVIQFAVSILLIISTTVVYKQLEYIRNKNLGYDKKYIVYIPLQDNLNKQYEAIKTKLLKYSDIKGITASSQLPVYFSNFTMGVNWETKADDESFLINTSFVDYNFIDLFDIQLVQGRNFSREYSTEQEQAYLVNEAAVKKMGLKSPTGKRFSIWNREGIIIGVVKDFHFRSLHKEIEPLALMVKPGEYDYLFAKISSGDIFNTVQFIKRTWQKFAPDEPFQYAFLDETIDRLYHSEQQTGRMMTYLTFLALFISCLGLFGLVSYMAQTRTKEIGVRKVLGASVANITKLFTADFAKWSLISNLIAWPIAWFAMNKWLQNFAYRVEISWWVFVLAGGLALFIALLTVSVQAVRAALANPVESLRYE